MSSLPISVPSPSVRHLFWLRFFCMLSYSMTYIAIPALLFKGAKSTWVAGMALIAEGVLRAAVSVAARWMHGRLGSRKAVAVAELMRLAGGVALIACLWQFHIVLLVAASCVYQFGYLTVVYEQELRCGQLQQQALAGQSWYRAAEILVLLPVLGAAIAFSKLPIPLLPLVLLGCVATCAHLLFSRRWHQLDTPRPEADGSVRKGLGYLLHRPDLRRGLIASTLAFSVFSLSLAAAPFLLKGHMFLGLDLTKQAGLALFKTTAAMVALGVTWTMAKLLTQKHSRLSLGVAAAGCAVSLALSQFASASITVVGLVALAPALAVTVVMAQRAHRQQALPVTQHADATAAYLAVECLSMSVAGAVLASGNVSLAMAGVAVVLLWAHWPLRQQTG